MAWWCGSVASSLVGQGLTFASEIPSSLIALGWIFVAAA